MTRTDKAKLLLLAQNGYTWDHKKQVWQGKLSFIMGHEADTMNIKELSNCLRSSRFFNKVGV